MLKPILAFSFCVAGCVLVALAVRPVHAPVPVAAPVVAEAPRLVSQTVELPEVVLVATAPTSAKKTPSRVRTGPFWTRVSPCRPGRDASGARPCWASPASERLVAVRTANPEFSTFEM